MYFRLLKALDVENVELQIVGREKVSFIFKGKNGLQKAKQKHAIFDRVDIIQQFDGPFLPLGDYQIPFKFTLPKGIPYSIIYRNLCIKARPKCEVKYFLRAILHSGSQRKMSHKQYLIVKELIMPENRLRNIHLKSEAPLTTWCFFSQGSTKLEVIVDKNVVTPNEKLNVRVKIDNSRCKLTIQNI